MIRVSLELDKKQLRSVERDLKKLETGMPKILSRAANKAVTSARVSLVRELQGRYTEKTSGLKRNIEIGKASYSDPTATIKVTGEPQPAIHFHHSKGGRGGVKLQVKTGGSPVALVSKAGRKAFIAQMPSGHKGIFQRRADKYMRKSKRMARRNINKRTQHTEQIKQILSPSPAKMAQKTYGSRDMAIDMMGLEIEGLFQKYIGQQVGLMLEKKKGGA